MAIPLMTECHAAPSMHVRQQQQCFPAEQLAPDNPCAQNFRNADGSRTMPAGGHKQLVGTKLRVRVTQVGWGWGMGCRCWCVAYPSQHMQDRRWEVQLGWQVAPDCRLLLHPQGPQLIPVVWCMLCLQELTLRHALCLQVMVPEKRLIVSEKAVLLDELANMLQVRREHANLAMLGWGRCSHPCTSGGPTCGCQPCLLGCCTDGWVLEGPCRCLLGSTHCMPLIPDSDHCSGAARRCD